jgi:hypothetical protein
VPALAERQRDRSCASGSRAGKLPSARTLPPARRLSGGAVDRYPRNWATGISHRFDHAWAKSTRTSRAGQLPASPRVGTLTRRLTIDPAVASTDSIETDRCPCMSWSAAVKPSHRDWSGLAGGAWRAPTGGAARPPVDLRSARAPVGCHATGPAWVPARPDAQGDSDSEWREVRCATPLFWLHPELAGSVGAYAVELL